MGPSPDDGTNQVLHLTLDVGVEGADGALHGTVRVSGSARAQRFSSALDLLRIIESEGARARRVHTSGHHRGVQPG